MRLDKLTIKAQEALQHAAEMAQEHGQQVLEPEHLALALLSEKEGIIQPLLQKIGATTPILKQELEKAIGKFPSVSGVGVQPNIGSSLQKVLEQAIKQADLMKDAYVSTEHLLLGLYEDSRVASLLVAAGISKDAMQKALLEIRGNQRVTDATPEDKFQSLEKYTRDLTKAAEAGKLDPVIGRDEEIRRVMQVLARRTKNNPVLIGEPGVGKTAIA